MTRVVRFRLQRQTRHSYEITLLPLLAQYGSTPIELLTRPTLENYLTSLRHLAYTTHRRHKRLCNLCSTLQ
jgi:integrase/recombinase XerD